MDEFMTVPCPYCSVRSPLADWTRVEDVTTDSKRGADYRAVFEHTPLRSYPDRSGARCPVCGDIVSTWWLNQPRR